MWLESIEMGIKQQLKSSDCARIHVGYSGGLDSTLMLAIACRAVSPENVTAIHVNHGLSKNNVAWQKHCQANADSLGCQFVTRTVSIENGGSGIEASARKFRYAQFSEILPKGGLLLLGHHLDDQVETFFLRLFRGTGVHGLKSMPEVSQREHYRLLRPLLSTPRYELEFVAQSLNLLWIEDDSNADTRFDRNYLRNIVLPLIEDRWPSYRERISTTISSMEDFTPQGDWDPKEELAHRLTHDCGLKIVLFNELSEHQKLTLIHSWLVSLGQLVPSKARLLAIKETIIEAKIDANPSVKVGEGYVRRHGPALYWVADQVDVGPAPDLLVDVAQIWQGVGRVKLVTILTGTARNSSSSDSLSSTDYSLAVRADLPDLNWRLRAGGEILQPVGRSKRRDLKRLLQEYRIKPWQRDRIPLLFSGDELVAVGDVLISSEHVAQKGEKGLSIDWQIDEIPD